MNPNLQEELMRKAQKQSELVGRDITQDGVNGYVVPTDAQNLQATQTSQTITPEFQTTQQVQGNVSGEVPQQPVAVDTSQSDTKSKIEEIERELGESSKSVTEVTAKAKVFMDEYGNETFYVKNNSNGHVVISDLDMNVLRGKSEDLLRYATLDDLKKSRDLRNMLAGDLGKSMLQRLTPEEYLEAKKIELDNKRRIEQMKISQAQVSQQAQQAQNQQQVNLPHNPPPLQPTTPRIRPTVLSKLEKLRLSSVPESAHLGMTSIEFTQWALTEDLNVEELDFIITHPNVVQNSEIRTALYDKRSKM